MISVLIVDDSERKRSKLRDFFNTSFDLIKDNIEFANDIKSARTLICEKSFDILLLDLVLPIEDGDTPFAENGVNFLNEISENPLVNCPLYIIGLTTYSEEKEKHESEFSDKLWHLVEYDSSTTEWEEKLKSIFYHLIKIRKEYLAPKNFKYEYDIAIITALREPELSEVLNLDGSWKEHRIENDATTYHSGYFEEGNKKLKVIAVSTPQMGMIATSVFTMKVVNNFRPKYLFMTGIAAGVEGPTKIGDILIADQIYEGVSGKIVSGDGDLSNIEPSPLYIPLDSDLLEKIRPWVSKDQYLFNLRREGQMKKPDHNLNIRIGPIVSVPFVLKNDLVMEALKQQQHKLIGLEMEGYGLMYSANSGFNPKPKAMIVKSVCDFADEKKNNDYQHYAAYTSAHFVYDFSLQEL